MQIHHFVAFFTRKNNDPKAFTHDSKGKKMGFSTYGRITTDYAARLDNLQCKTVPVFVNNGKNHLGPLNMAMR